VIGAAGFDAYAVTARSGPHVTLQAGVLHLGRHWTTTIRTSVKAGAVRRTGWAAASSMEGRRCRVVGGPASLLDPVHPSTITSEPVNTMLAGGALLRLGLGRLDQILGYAEAGRAVPLSFLPTGRVLLTTRLRDELVLEGDTVVRAGGRWDRAGAELDVRRGRPPRWQPDRVLDGAPEEITLLAGRAGPGWIGVQTGTGAVALPAAWDPSTGRLKVALAGLGAVAAELPGPVCVTLHDSGRRRPDEKMGVMLRGVGTVVDRDGRAASVAIDVERVTHWSGFDTTTVHEAA
jgi:hypothetical protein